MLKYVITISLLLLIVGCGLSLEEQKNHDEYLSRAQVYYQNGKYPNALQQIELALEIDKESKRALISKGWTLFFLQKYEDAQEIFERVHDDIDNTDPWLHEGLGSVAFKLGTQAENKLVELEYRKQITPDNKERFEKEAERFVEERDDWYTKSLEHLEKVIRVNPDNFRIYKTLAMVYAAKGLDHHLQVVSHTDKYIEYLDDNLEQVTKSLKENQEKRLEPSIPEREHEVYDEIIEVLETRLEQNRKEYRVVQAMVGDILYQLAAKNQRLEEEEESLTKKELYKSRKIRFAERAKDRILIILKTAPELANHYRNLAGIARLIGDDEAAAKYLKEYLRLYPFADPKIRASISVELDELKKEKE